MCCYILWFFMKAFAPKKGSESCCRSFICVKVCLLLWSIRDSSSGKIAPRELWRCEPRHWEGKHCLHTTWAPVFQGQFFNCRETPQYVWGGHHRILRGLHSIEEIESGTELISESEIILCPFQIRIFCDSMTLWEHKPSAREKDGDTWGEFMWGKKKHLNKYLGIQSLPEYWYKTALDLLLVFTAVLSSCTSGWLLSRSFNLLEKKSSLMSTQQSKADCLLSKCKTATKFHI